MTPSDQRSNVRRTALTEVRHGYSFDDSRHPVWAIANGIAVFFLGTTAVGFLLLIADAFLIRA
jgi:hypothetical protein